MVPFQMMSQEQSNKSICKTIQIIINLLVGQYFCQLKTPGDRGKMFWGQFVYQDDSMKNDTEFQFF